MTDFEQGIRPGSLPLEEDPQIAAPPSAPTPNRGPRHEAMRQELKKVEFLAAVEVQELDADAWHDIPYLNRDVPRDHRSEAI